jgi:hypothetical protein
VYDVDMSAPSPLERCPVWASPLFWMACRSDARLPENNAFCPCGWPCRRLLCRASELCVRFGRVRHSVDHSSMGLAGISWDGAVARGTSLCTDLTVPVVVSRWRP